MADYTVISDIGLSLVKVLRRALVPELIGHPDGVGLAHPHDKGDMNLTLYLFEVKENTDFRSNEMIDQGDRMRFPPIAMDLTYLITAHSASDVLSRSIDEHRMLGKTLQVLHDHNVLKGDDLVGSLTGTDGQFRIVKEEIPLDTAISLFPNMPYKLSLCYRIGPVFVDSTRVKTTSRVRERQVHLKQKK
ncbi:DUF4255 domain-containing protein [Paenibacillus thalictri]|uniref:DUF4255 domain-containing protein n=1 Tax=Paenibacillus thalictri TaxID=2527873 RepID=A0A4Q9DY61_9BACL|nr:DUF4255 domain-containing protein [Paenibacillus thalictri]TBL80778.1 DUF4255 domain-containing protein [Paenibacillus thalictri]